MEILGYIAAALIGGSLGLIGAGGSILTVPVMVYFFDVPVLLASSYSLAIVGFTSLLGASGKYRQGEVRTKIALLFSITSVLVVTVVRHYLVPVIPHDLFAIKGVPVEYAAFSMVLFSVLMVIAAVSMIRGRKCSEETCVEHRVSLPAVLLSSIAVGLITGLLGAGGGFLIVPAMVFLFKLPMKQAVGTSLFIIAINSILGFTMDLSHFHINWIFLLTFTFIAAAGIFAGMMVGMKIPGYKLKSAFGWFVMVIGIVIFSREVAGFVTKTNNHHRQVFLNHRDRVTQSNTEADCAPLCLSVSAVQKLQPTQVHK